MKAPNTQLECFDGQMRISLSVGPKVFCFWVNFQNPLNCKKVNVLKWGFFSDVFPQQADEAHQRQFP